MIIVTGASRGIGAAVARLAANLGPPIAVNYSRDRTRAEGVVADIVAAGGRALAIQADISRETDVLRLFETAEQELGALTGLVNNAGVTGGFTRVENVTVRAIEEAFSVNVTGTILCCREAVRRMSTKRGGIGGAIVNVTSTSVRTGGTGEWVHYAAAKGAVHTFTLGLAREVADEGIRVNAVAPGLVQTDLHAANGQPDRPKRMSPSIPMLRAGRPEEIAEGVVWLLSQAASYTTGSILEIGGGR